MAVSRSGPSTPGHVLRTPPESRLARTYGGAVVRRLAVLILPCQPTVDPVAVQLRLRATSHTLPGASHLSILSGLRNGLVRWPSRLDARWQRSARIPAAAIQHSQESAYSASVAGSAPTSVILRSSTKHASIIHASIAGLSPSHSGRRVGRNARMAPRHEPLLQTQEVQTRPHSSRPRSSRASDPAPFGIPIPLVAH